MVVKIIRDPDVYVSESDYARYRDEYAKAFSFYAGTPPSFSSWVAERIKRDRAPDRFHKMAKALL